MERGPAEEALAAGSARAGRARAPECVRRQRRRELDARRGKCRIRIGGHLERWCRLKEQLGFALHSQLAEFLLDRYGSPGCTWGPGDSAPEGLRPAALQRLVALSHGHGQECGFVPDVLLPAPGVAAPLVWECVAGHRFSWGGSGRPDGPSRDPPGAARGRGPAAGGGRRRSLRGTAPGSAGAGAEGADGSPRGAGGRGGEPEDGDAGGGAAPRAPPEPGPAAGESAAPGTDGGPRVVPRGEEEGAGFDGGAGPACAGDPHDGDCRPSPDSVRRRPRAGDGEAARIGPKRIRKAAKREILLCDFEGCGRIFSNRQYLNHHRKYQHVHQRTFTCSEPTCGRSFNFKKHLKEHEKLHSDRRDYICEFCARSFRTSSNLIIHRRIHTGEKPLQCEICGFTCRQKASLNWHMRKHDADSSYRFPCDVCGRRFEKRDNVAAHKSKSHPGELGGPPGPEALGRRPEPPGPAGPPEPLGGVPEGGGDAGGAPLGCGVGDVGRDPGAPRGRVVGEGGS